MRFEPYPFEKLALLLKDIKVNSDNPLIDLTIGEPKFQTPQGICNSLSDNTDLLNKYPKSSGEPYLKDAMIKFFKYRFDIKLDTNEIIPTFGTREVLFNLPQFLLHDIENSTMAYTNPFYQIYEGARIATNSSVIYINLQKQNNFKAKLLSDKQFSSCDLVILNFPNNPTGASIDIDELVLWVKKAIEFDFVLINDECYSELYGKTKPPSLLQASIKAGNKEFKNCLVLNSISKRSSAPGLRSGFVAGDKQILKNYMRYRTYVGCALPLPLQKASATAWSDEKSAESFRQVYRQNLKLAKDILEVDIFDDTFYVWLEVEDELEFTKLLYQKEHLKVLPGSYLGRDGAGVGYVRLALVENSIKTKDSLLKIKKLLKSSSKDSL